MFVHRGWFLWHVVCIRRCSVSKLTSMRYGRAPVSRHSVKQGCRISRRVPGLVLLLRPGPRVPSSIALPLTSCASSRRPISASAWYWISGLIPSKWVRTSSPLFWSRIAPSTSSASRTPTSSLTELLATAVLAGRATIGGWKAPSGEDFQPIAGFQAALGYSQTSTRLPSGSRK